MRKQLSHPLKDTASESSNRKYIGNIQWETALRLNLLLKRETPSLAEFREALYLAWQGSYESKPVYNCRGNKMAVSDLQQFLSEVTEQREPWRAELLDTRFEEENNQLVIAYQHRMQSGKLVPQKREILAPCLMQNKTPGIFLEDWLQRATQQGFPPADVQAGEVDYWFPRAGSVAWFGAGSVRVYLICGGGRRGSGAALGVRSIIRAEGAQKFLEEPEIPKVSESSQEVASPVVIPENPADRLVTDLKELVPSRLHPELEEIVKRYQK